MTTVLLAAAPACQSVDDDPASTVVISSETALPGAPIHGYLGARRFAGDNGMVMVPDLDVWARNAATGADSPHVKTNVAGYFQTPPLLDGTYRVCAAGPGFIATCEASSVEVAGQVVVLDHQIALAPAASAVWGTVRLGDGSPCYWERQGFDTLVVARIQLLDPVTGAPVAAAVRGNSVGQFVVPFARPAGSYKVQATCEAAIAQAVVAAPRTAAIDLVVDNRPPTIAVVDFSKGGVGIRRADPGDTVTASITASDPDGDALHYRWIDDSGRALGLPDAPSVSWPLFDATTRSSIFVQVSDGKGGFAVWRRSLRTDDGKVVISGRVIDRATGAPLGQAEVAVGGAAMTTGADGQFEVTLPDATRFVLSANKRGYALTSRAYQVANRNLEIPLDKAQTRSFEATAGGSLQFTTTRKGQDKPLVFDLRIDPGAFVDATGAPYKGPVTMEQFHYDTSQPYPIPGDQAGVWGGKAVRLKTSGSFHLTPRDKQGRRLRMASGKAAEVEFDIEPAQRASAPATIPFFLYDEVEGTWLEHGTLTRGGDRYKGRITHFTAFNADTTFTNSACLKLVIDPGLVSGVEFPLYLSGTYTDPATGVFEHNDTAIPDLDTPIGIVRLAPFQSFEFVIRDARHSVLRTVRLDSGAPVPAGPGVRPDGWIDDPSFAPCTLARISLGDLPAIHPPFLVPAAAPDHSDAYRRATAAADGQPKATLAGWRAENGFPPTGPAADEVHGTYFNDGDLKFGRDMHCRKTPATGKVACYVSNFGVVGTDDAPVALAEARASDPHPVATVCMEYDPSVVDPALRVQFWAYNGVGDYLAAPVLDSEGPKTMPDMCQACHGGFFNGASAARAAFLPFDVESFKYDDLGNPFTGPDALARQNDFRQLNALVLDTSPGAATTELIRGWYPLGITVPQPFHVVSAAVDFPFEPSGTAHAELYDDVVAPVCRTCHVTRPAGGDWTRFAQMTAGRIGPRVCGPLSSPLSFLMPHAEVPFKRFWQRGLSDVLARELPLPGGCPSR